ncbi:hypothetical protein IU501_34725 [Nocardia otitidiscaviarum]|uniref:hypothetical protein n=1 Tax=Nocardia otitidiscaviarum TaxID=1823 RepID=UPI0018940BED|nr:hypothetical protein [Nocardia otitidiscaviarum]MBF6138126.1 hypothetical protein [Nocardia otitidiscaviarum]
MTAMAAAPVVAFGVVAHHARRDAALTLAGGLDAMCSIDDGTLGAEANHRVVWTACAAERADWVCVLEDDAQPVDDFPAQLAVALAVAPSPVVSLYLGTSMSAGLNERIRRALVRADRLDACWVISERMLHAVAICLRADLVRDMLTITRNERRPADQRFERWLRARGLRVAYSVPSLVDHADGPTLIAHPDRLPRRRQRKAWTVGGREHWNGSTVLL